MRKAKHTRWLAQTARDLPSLDAFLVTLTAAKVTTLLDVRELAISRRKGFSKSALTAALESVGIAYRHERALGAPRDVRRVDQ